MRCFVLLCLLIASCGPGAITEAGDGPNPWHLVPFKCTYLGFKLHQLDGCQIACPRSTFEKHNIKEFTANLTCTHPNYSLLSCGID